MCVSISPLQVATYTYTIQTTPQDRKNNQGRNIRVCIALEGRYGIVHTYGMYRIVRYVSLDEELIVLNTEGALTICVAQWILVAIC